MRETAEKSRAERRRELLHLLCSVLTFTPASVPGLAESECRDVLRSDLDPAASAGGEKGYKLRTDVRIEALRAHRDAASVLAAARSMPARAMSPAQQAFEDYLENGFFDLENTDATTEDLQRMAFWLEHVDWARQEAQRLQGELWRARQTGALEAMGGSAFVGRAKELATLREFAERGPGPEPELLLIDAVGGMGKTALLARFQLDVSSTGIVPGLPEVVVYVDFDQPQLDVRSPASLLAELLAGLGARAPEFRGFAEDLATFQSEDVGGFSAVQQNVRVHADSRLMVTVERTRDLLASAVSSGSIGRVVVILDTFERPTRQSPESAARALAMVWRIVEGVAGVLIVAGRGMTQPGLEHMWPTVAQRMHLRELDPDHARELLRSQGIKDDATAERILSLVPLRPLTLRLAARALAAGELTGPDLEAAVADRLVDGYLHLRILDHLESPRVAALVHPGFVLRRITKDAIRTLLAKLPSPPVRDDADADELFEGLRRVNDLVLESVDRPGLVLRPDVRRELLALIIRDDGAAAQQVHREARAWYAQQSTPEAGVEAAYHALMLGDVGALGRLSAQDLADLMTNVAEMPALSQEALRSAATRIGAGPSSRPAPIVDALNSARDVHRRLELLMTDGRLEDADALLARMGPSSDPELLRLEAKLRRMQGRAEEAADAAQRAMSNSTSTERAELKRTMAWAIAQGRPSEDLAKALADAEVALRARNAPPLEALAAWADLALLAGFSESLVAERQRYGEETARLFAQVLDSDLSRNRLLLLSAAAVLPDADSLGRAFRLGALDDMRDVTRTMVLAIILPALAGPWPHRGQDVAALLDPPTTATGLTRVFNKALSIIDPKPSPEKPRTASILEAARRLFAAEHRAATTFVPGRAAVRADALDALIARVGASTDRDARIAIATALGVVRVLRTETTPQELVMAADGARRAIDLVDYLMRRAPRDELVDLFSLRRRLARPATFESVPHDAVVQAWRTYAAAPDLGAEVTRLLASWRLDWVFSHWQAPPEVILLEALDLLCQREGATFPTPEGELTPA